MGAANQCLQVTWRAVRSLNAPHLMWPAATRSGRALAVWPVSINHRHSTTGLLYGRLGGHETQRHDH